MSEPMELAASNKVWNIAFDAGFRTIDRFTEPPQASECEELMGVIIELVLKNKLCNPGEELTAAARFAEGFLKGYRIGVKEAEAEAAQEPTLPPNTAEKETKIQWDNMLVHSRQFFKNDRPRGYLGDGEAGGMLPNM